MAARVRGAEVKPLTAQELAALLIKAANKEAQQRAGDPNVMVMVTAYIVTYKRRRYLISVKEID